jgi:hypothetical protein
MPKLTYGLSLACRLAVLLGGYGAYVLWPFEIFDAAPSLDIYARAIAATGLGLFAAMAAYIFWNAEVEKGK